MQVNIDGRLTIEHPTQVWMQLKNTQRVLARKHNWNNEGWWNPSGSGTMCLANAARWVARGHVAQAGVFNREPGEREEVENLLLYVINTKMTSASYRPYYDDIPDFNDEAGRRHAEIRAVIDKAIEVITPYAQVEATVIADDVMTPEEHRQIREAIWDVETKMWQEYSRSVRARKDHKGTWRDGFGRFIKVPRWVRVKDQIQLPDDTTKTRAMTEFRRWLDGHQQRGWGTFWDELAECDEHDEECKKRRLQLSRKPPSISEIIENKIRSTVL